MLLLLPSATLLGQTTNVSGNRTVEGTFTVNGLTTVQNIVITGTCTIGGVPCGSGTGSAAGATGAVQANNGGLLGDSGCSTDLAGNMVCNSYSTPGITPQNGVLALAEQAATATQFPGIFQIAALSSHTQVCSTNSGWNECFAKTFAMIQPGTNTGALHVGSGGSLTIDSGASLVLTGLANGCASITGGVVGSTTCGSSTGGGGFIWPIAPKSADYLIAATDFSTATSTGNCLELNGSVAHQFTLPAAGTITVNGEAVCVANKSTNTLTIATTGGMTIDGASTYLVSPGTSSWILYDTNTSQWKTVGRRRLNSDDIGPTMIAPTTGSANAYSLTLPVLPPNGLVIGWIGGFKANFTNTGPSTLTINGLGPYSIKRCGITTNVNAGDIVSANYYLVMFDFGTSVFQMVNPNTPCAGGGSSGLADPGANGIVTRTALNTTGIAAAADVNALGTLSNNTTGTAANLTAAALLPSGTTATTQAAADNSTKLATTAYVDRVNTPVWTFYQTVQLPASTGNITITAPGCSAGVCTALSALAADHTYYWRGNAATTVQGTTCTAGTLQIQQSFTDAMNGQPYSGVNAPIRSSIINATTIGLSITPATVAIGPGAEWQIVGFPQRIKSGSTLTINFNMTAAETGCGTLPSLTISLALFDAGY